MADGQPDVRINIDYLLRGREIAQRKKNDIDKLAIGTLILYNKTDNREFEIGRYDGRCDVDSSFLPPDLDLYFVRIGLSEGQKYSETGPGRWSMKKIESMEVYSIPTQHSFTSDYREIVKKLKCIGFDIKDLKF